MKAGTLASSEKPKRGRPTTKKPEETAEIEAKPVETKRNVIESADQIDSLVTAAINSGKKALLVTADVLKSVLRERYKDDAYMIYRNVELHDVEKHAETLKNAKMTTSQKVFGHSKVGIASNPAPQGKA